MCLLALAHINGALKKSPGQRMRCGGPPAAGVGHVRVLVREAVTVKRPRGCGELRGDLHALYSVLSNAGPEWLR